MDEYSSRSYSQWSSRTSRIPRDFPLAQLGDRARITRSDGETVTGREKNEVLDEPLSRGLGRFPGQISWPESNSSSLSSSSKRRKDTFIAHGAAADIWLVELATRQTTSPVQYICKTLRVEPESFQDQYSNSLLGDIQDKNVGQIQEDFIRDFHIKLAQWNRIQHDNIVQVYESSDKADAYLNVEFCIHGTARQYLSSHNQTADLKHTMISNVLKGVEYLHTRTPPIIHGCLNMDKIFVSGDGTTRIGEFGLAAFTRSFALLAPSISYTGLSRWMSPELVDFDPEMGAPEPTTASDVWALGCTLYEIVSGELPYSKYKHELRVRREIIRGIHPAHRPYNDEKSKFSIWSILESCWETSPNVRPSASIIRLQHGAFPTSPSLPTASPQSPPLFPVPRQVSSPAASSSHMLSRSGTISTQFTRRPMRQLAWPATTQANGILSHINDWHKEQYHQQILGFQCVSSEGTWEAVPTIFGEPHPQYAGRGTSIPLAKAAAAQKIADSGHC